MATTKTTATQAKASTKTARVLVSCRIGATTVQANQLVTGPTAVIDSAKRAGKVDDSEAAVQYAAEVLGETAIELDAKARAQPTRDEDGQD